MIATAILDQAYVEIRRPVDVLEVALKGRELKLPMVHYRYDKDGHKRTKLRIQWFRRAKKDDAYRYLAFPPDDGMLEQRIDFDLTKNVNYYSEDKPVFFGYYWLKENSPKLNFKNAICLDCSVVKGGFLSAYVQDGSNVTADNFVFC